jgi:hypothetical protein
MTTQEALNYWREQWHELHTLYFNVCQRNKALEKSIQHAIDLYDNDKPNTAMQHLEDTLNDKTL